MAATTKARAGHPLFQQNLLDRAIAYFDPERAVRRLKSVTLAGGGNGAAATKPAQQLEPGSGSPTTDAVAICPPAGRAAATKCATAASPPALSMNAPSPVLVGTGLSAIQCQTMSCSASASKSQTWARNTLPPL